MGMVDTPGASGFHWHTEHWSEWQPDTVRDWASTFAPHENETAMDTLDVHEHERGVELVQERAPAMPSTCVLGREEMTELARAWLRHNELPRPLFEWPQPRLMNWDGTLILPQAHAYIGGVRVYGREMTIHQDDVAMLPDDMTALAKAWLAYSENQPGSGVAGAAGVASGVSAAETLVDPSADSAFEAAIVPRLDALFSGVQQLEGEPLEWRARYQGTTLLMAFRIIETRSRWSLQDTFRVPGPYYPIQGFGVDKASLRPELTPDAHHHAGRFGVDWCIGLWRVKLDPGDPEWISSIPFTFRCILSEGYTLVAGDFYHEAERYLRRKLRAELYGLFGEGRLPEIARL
jgi:hypothetical protein